MSHAYTDALATQAVYAELSNAGLIAFQGDDTTTFLQGQLTNDARQLTQQQAQYSGFCSPKGRLLGSFLLWQQADSTYLQLAAELQPSLQKRLSMYILRAKVKTRDACGEVVRIGVAGHRAAEIVNAVTGCMPEADMKTAEAGANLVIRFNAERYQIIAPVADRDNLLAQLSQQHAVSVDAGYWQWLEIRAGVPTITLATQEQFVPQMVNFDLTNSVNFQKGCYTGQEIVARTQYLGKLKRRMYLVHSNEVMAEGDEIYSPDMEGQAMGMVVNAQPAPEGGWDALVVMQISSVATQPLHLKSLDGALLSLQDLPYSL
ncbi:YgfZ/GcvT domain-containing protein [Sulfuriferula nivalis]|uniref:Folate-binding protein n=1 Tax=Sulfuriferula nivalis TaxID=2675298 RepID=A0A809RL39_9PROT|nr:folate-binding protein YgfZ [Sulfuriferula nivalis]BBP01524.1 folate-binding protein [Sulfuriferula nivalis]